MLRPMPLLRLKNIYIYNITLYNISLYIYAQHLLVKVDGAEVVEADAALGVLLGDAAVVPLAKASGQTSGQIGGEIGGQIGIK